MKANYYAKEIERRLKLMDDIINSDKTIVELFNSNEFYSAECSCSTFIENSKSFGLDTRLYEKQKEALLTRFSKLTENYLEEIKEIVKPHRSKKYNSLDIYTPNIISTRNLRSR